MEMDEMQKAAEPSSSSPPALGNGELITSVNHNDVLLGRGSRQNDFVGNRQFRSIVEERSEEYYKVPQNKVKEKIAWEVFDRIHALGGRFLKEVESDTPVHDVEEGVWIEVEKSVAIQKCKQALRDQNRERQRLPKQNRKRNHRGGGEGLLEAMKVQGDPTSFPMGSCDLNSVLPSMFNDSLLTSLAPTLAVQQPVTMNQVYPSQLNFISHRQNDLSVLPRVMHPPTDRGQLGGLLQDMHLSLNEAAESASQNSLEDSAMQGLLHLREGSVASPHVHTGDVDARDRSSRVDGRSDGISSVARSFESFPSSDALTQALEDRSRFTEELVAMERAMMTDEERSEALADLFGKQCAVDIHHSKRARGGFDPKTVEFLVNQMRIEIERIPVANKLALLEAQEKCLEGEFSDARLERFLRCEGMNVKLGAQRFVNYWESRRDLFGPEKYLMPMTLSGALRDDLIALEAGVQQILPHPDTSRRQMLFWELQRHTREGYTSESLLRSIWYVMEVLAQENTDMNSGAVMVVWDKNSSIWDYDRKVYDRMVYFEAKCWPVKLLAHHICGSAVFSFRLLKPIVYALVDKRTRSRILIHDVPDSRIFEDLSSYGILKCMLPVEMGGTVQLNPSRWIADRRAIELGEI